MNLVPAHGVWFGISRYRLKILSYAVASIALTCVASAFALKVAAVRVEHRASELLSDMRTLRVGQSTFPDARRVGDHYHAWLAHDLNSCTSEDCELSFWSFHGWGFLHWWSDRPSLWYRAMNRIGVRPNRVVGDIIVRHGRVASVHFGLMVEGPDKSWIAGDVSEVSPEHSDAQYVIRRPVMEIGGGGNLLVADVTTDATATERERAFDFTVQCISQLTPCTLNQLIPKLVTDYASASRPLHHERRYPSPDGALVAIIVPIDSASYAMTPESRIRIEKPDGSVVWTANYSSQGGENGFGIVRAGWTSDSGFLAFGMENGKGDSLVLAYSRAGNRAIPIALRGQVYSPFFSLDADTVHVYGWKEGAQETRRISLSTAAATARGIEPSSALALEKLMSTR